jgi:dihydrolipoamide dehydrogenase
MADGELTPPQKLEALMRTGGADQRQIDKAAVLSEIRRIRDHPVSGVVSGMEDRSTSHLIEHAAQFADDGTLRTDSLMFHPHATVIATGTSPVVPLEWLETHGDRLLTSDGLFETETLPGRIAVIGMGPVKLELGQALARLGVEVTGFDPSPNLGGIFHPDLQDLARSAMRSEFRIVATTAEPELGKSGVVNMNWDDECIEVDCVLAAMGRKPNLEGLGLHNLGIDTDADSPPEIDESCLNIPGTRIYLASDVSGVRPLLHEVADEVRIAGYSAVRDGNSVCAARTSSNHLY